MEIEWFLVAEATTTNINTGLATTSGPFKIPEDAPDIAGFYHSTTVASEAYDIILGTTNYYDTPSMTWAKAISANKRCFNIAAAAAVVHAGAPIKIRYRAVGELVRS